jgi:sugar lactone lactonase YvrE
MEKLQTMLDGLCFPEGPRWHEGRLYFSDMHAHAVIAVDLAGRPETIVEVPNQPSGLGWLPDGRMLVVSMTDRKLMRLDHDGLKLHGDMHQLASFHCNDMVVDAKGRAYVGNFGFDFHAQAEQKPAEIIMVTPQGETTVVAQELQFPNGMVITPDGRTLIAAESFGRRLSAFEVGADGSLSKLRVWAELGSLIPDGICLDAEGAVWVACPFSSQVVRVLEGGKITETIKVETDAFACMLGGPNRQTLFIATAKSSEPEECKKNRTGRIEMTHARVPGAGLP